MQTHSEEPQGHGLIWLLAAIVLVSLIASGALWLRRHRREAQETERRAQRLEAGPKMKLAKVIQPPARQQVTLPGDARGFTTTTVYGKLSGYVVRMNVDKGDRVHKGQLIAVLEAPDADDQVAAAKASLALQEITAVRFRALAKAGLVAKQDLDTVENGLDLAVTTLARAQVQQQYKIVRAPFEGVVSARYVDPGALIPAATAATQSVLPLVDLTDGRRLRIVVFLGQDVAPFVRVGDSAIVTEDQHPNRRVEARVSRLASALDLRSRTMLCEIWVDNPKEVILPGVFVHVTLTVVVPQLPAVPAEAVFMRGSKNYVAVVRERRVHFVPIDIPSTDGKVISLRGAVQVGDEVALNVPTELEDGSVINF